MCISHRPRTNQRQRSAVPVEKEPTACRVRVCVEWGAGVASTRLSLSLFSLCRAQRHILNSGHTTTTARRNNIVGSFNHAVFRTKRSAPSSVHAGAHRLTARSPRTREKVAPRTRSLTARRGKHSRTDASRSHVTLAAWSGGDAGAPHPNRRSSTPSFPFG